MARPPGKFTRALRDSAGNIKRKVNQARDAFGRFTSTLLNDKGEEAQSHEVKRVFQRHYRKHGQQLQRRSATISQFYRDSPKRDPNTKRQTIIRNLGSQHLGRMFMFVYDPKWKHDDKKLPYYDYVPLILLMEVRQNGRILGLNMHYLPPRQRAFLMDAINDNELRNGYKEAKRLRFSYAIMKRASKSNLYKNCVKEYIVKGNHVRSPFLQIPSNEWENVLFMPYERFKKQSREYAWRDTMRKARS